VIRLRNEATMVKKWCRNGSARGLGVASRDGERKC